MVRQSQTWETPAGNSMGGCRPLANPSALVTRIAPTSADAGINSLWLCPNNKRAKWEAINPKTDRFQQQKTLTLASNTQRPMITQRTWICFGLVPNVVALSSPSPITSIRQASHNAIGNNKSSTFQIKGNLLPVSPQRLPVSHTMAVLISIGLVTSKRIDTTGQKRTHRNTNQRQFGRVLASTTMPIQQSALQPKHPTEHHTTGSTTGRWRTS